MSALTLVRKTPADVLDYDVDFTRWLPDGDVIVGASAVIEVEDPPVTFVIDQTVFSEAVVRVWVSGGVDDEEGEISVVATTQGGRVKTACFRLRIVEC